MSYSNSMTIGRLALATHCSVPTIRYYEEVGLLPVASRASGGQRIYSSTDLQLLTFVRRCRDFGFPIERIKKLVAILGAPEQDCTAARDLAQQHLTKVRRKVKELRALEQSLKQYVEDCDTHCAGGPSKACVILEDLSAPKQTSCCGSSREVRVLSRSCNDDCSAEKA